MRRKFTCKAHGQQIVLIKQHNENVEHVVMKALLWALYLPAYPTVRVEVNIGDRYKPDLIALDGAGEPVFWGEAGQVGEAKWRALLRRYPHTHFAWGKWATRLTPHVALVETALGETALGDRVRRAAIDILAFPADSATRFFDVTGEISVAHNALTWVRLLKGAANVHTPEVNRHV